MLATIAMVLLVRDAVGLLVLVGLFLMFVNIGTDRSAMAPPSRLPAALLP